MKFSSRETMEMPIEAAFALLSDFSDVEERLQRRGAHIARTDDLTGPCRGMTWCAEFALHGRQRAVDVTLSIFDPTKQMRFDLASDGLEGEADLRLAAITEAQTQLTLEIELRPRTIAARILMKSLKLAKTQLDQRLQDRVAGYIREIEARYHDTG
ncbi:SRPBCC family protein [uncultured Roseobacter sp.]|uniref:SRPBCC family protein n=1 Tax=uncultured Roseobacter sp. TaxID=114847 RepID=UPI0026391C3D|nr:SRPBCC family protein [uncultured Roseobacter sp.]